MLLGLWQLDTSNRGEKNVHSTLGRMALGALMSRQSPGHARSNKREEEEEEE